MKTRSCGLRTTTGDVGVLKPKVKMISAEAGSEMPQSDTHPLKFHGKVKLSHAWMFNLPSMSEYTNGFVRWQLLFLCRFIRVNWVPKFMRRL
jgi:hypothetical protein